MKNAHTGRHSKGQAALDFLMTYGWAILLVILVAAALFVLGIFDIGRIIGNKAVGFSELAVAAFSLQSNGTLTLKLQNEAGKKVDVGLINATMSGTSIQSNAGVSNLGVGALSNTINVGSFGNQTAGQSYTMTVTISYTDRNTQFAYNEAGTLNGIVTP